MFELEVLKFGHLVDVCKLGQGVLRCPYLQVEGSDLRETRFFCCRGPIREAEIRLEHGEKRVVGNCGGPPTFAEV